VKNWA
jgi:hypothetical protein